MGECIRIVMDSTLGEWGTALRAKNDNFLHCWVRMIGGIFVYTKSIPWSTWYYFQEVSWKMLL
jgi:hypothetical protein